ncbi:hypothetical protein [Arenibaculum sp.]|uniref:hypothetical protein n=1 Tax=Arenibaculum sp. TaxID=2865862 RepID=UPI002E119B2B|nr:hypothetical protein [Arenibaculum sp.]
MIRIVTAAAALLMMSGVAMAEPVKLTDTQLQTTSAGQPLLSVLSGFRLLTDFQVALNNQVGAAIGIGGDAVQQNNSWIVQVHKASRFKIFDLD